MYEDVIKAVREKRTMNPLGNDLTSGIWCVQDHYDIDFSSMDEPCDCITGAESLLKEIAYHNENPGKTLYYSPKEIKLFGTKVSDKMYSLNIPNPPACTGRCTPKSDYDLIIAEVKKIVKDSTYVSPYLTKKGL